MGRMAEMTAMGASHKDSSAFDVLLARHIGIVHKVAAAYANSPDDRRDLGQEICLQLCKAFPRYDHERRFSTWMYRIALNVAISFARTAYVQRSTVALEDSDAHLLEANAAPDVDERIELLQQLIAMLDPLDRALLMLYLEEYSYREIAETVGITETNVATKIGRLKQRVRKNIVHRQ